MTQVIYDGQGRHVGVKQATFDIPDRQAKIRNSFLEGSAKHQQAAATWAKNQSNELLTALRTKAEVESKNKLSIFEKENSDNKRIAANILKNKETEIKNLRTEADNFGRKGRALQELAPSIGKVIEQGDRILDEMAQVKAESEYNNSDSHPEEETPEQEVALKKEEKAHNQVQEDLRTGPNPLPEHVIRGWTGYSQRVKNHILDIHHKRTAARSIIAFNSFDGGASEAFFPTPMGKVNLEAAQNWIQGLPYKERKAQEAKLWGAVQTQFRKGFKGVYGLTNKRYSRFYRKALAKSHDDWVRNSDNRDEKAAKKQQNIDTYAGRIKGPYLKFREKGYDERTSLEYTRKGFFMLAPDTWTEKQKQVAFDQGILAGIYAGEISPKLARSYTRVNVEPRQWKSSNDLLEKQKKKRKLQSIAKTFPRSTENILRAVDEVETEKAKEFAAERKKNENLEKGQVDEAIRNLDKFLEDNPFATREQIWTYFNGPMPGRSGWSNKTLKRLQKYVLEDIVTVYDRNAETLNFTYERMILDGHPNIEEVIDGWPISPQKKLELKKDLKARGGSMSNPVRKRYSNALLSATRPWIINQAQDEKQIDWRWHEKIRLTEKAITERAIAIKAGVAKEKDMQGKSNDEIWDRAYQIALDEIFTQDFKNRHEKGNFWSALSFEEAKEKGGFASVKMPAITGAVKYDSLSLLKRSVEKDDFTFEGYMTDGNPPENRYEIYPQMLKLEESINNGTPYSPSKYVRDAAYALGMTPEKFVYISSVKWNNAKSPTPVKIDWENTDFGKAEAALAALSPSVRQLLPDQLPSKESTDVVMATQIMADTGIEYGDIIKLAEHPEWFQRFTSAATQRILHPDHKFQQPLPVETE